MTPNMLSLPKILRFLFRFINNHSKACNAQRIKPKKCNRSNKASKSKAKKMSSTAKQTALPTPEDAFYDNLTLGLMKTLNNFSRVSNVTLEKRQPCERAQVTTWEQRHNVYLPEDMKRLYLSTDGLLLHWCYQYSPDDVRRVGRLQIPHLSQITLLRDTMELITASAIATSSSSSTTQFTSSIPKNAEAIRMTNPSLNARSKIFEINNVCETAKVCMIYETPESVHPTIYLLETDSLKWQFLSDNFAEYIRMAIAHLGLPYWELCFSTCGLPSWTEQLFLLIAPHLLEKSELRRNRILPTSHDQPPLNQLDPSIFRTKPKCLRQNPKK